ncbi:MAG: hypothetical protein SGBAC_009783 [Bacillariaceae sp.]
MDHQGKYNEVIPLDEQDLSISDMKSADYFSIDLNFQDDMSDCSSVSLPSIIGGKRIFLRRQMAEDGDDENDNSYEEECLQLKPECIEPSSHFQPVYSSDDEDMSFVTFEEESYYTYTSVDNNTSEHTSVYCSEHIHNRSPSASHRRRIRMGVSDHSASRRRNLRLSGHSASRRSRRTRKELSSDHDRSNSMCRSHIMVEEGSVLRRGLLQAQVAKIARELSGETSEDNDEDNDEFSYKSLDFGERPFGPSAEALLKQRQAGSQRNLLGTSGHTTDAIVHSSASVSSDDQSMDQSMDQSGDFSFYEEETLEGSTDGHTNDSEDFEIKSPSAKSTSVKMTNLAEAISGFTAHTLVDSHSESSRCTQSQTESTEEDKNNDMCPPAEPHDLADMTPKVDLTRKAWARRRRSEVTSKLQQLKEQMNSVYGAPLGTISSIPTAPMSSIDSMPYLGESFDLGAAQEGSIEISKDSMQSSSSFFNASMRSTGSLLEKRQLANSKREQLRLAFHAFSSPSGRTQRRSRSRSLSPSGSNHSNSKSSSSRLPVNRMQTPVL